MTNKELINLLLQFPKYLEVVIYHEDEDIDYTAFRITEEASIEEDKIIVINLEMQ